MLATNRFCTACGSLLPAEHAAGAPPEASNPYLVTPGRSEAPKASRDRAGEQPEGLEPPTQRVHPIVPVSSDVGPRPSQSSGAGSVRGTVPRGVLVGGGLAVVVLVLVILALSLGGTAASTSQPADAAGKQAMSSPSASGAPAFGSGEDNSSSADTAADPETALRALADDDRAVVDSTLGQWVPQLSAKKSGLVADGQSYDSAAVLQNHQRLRSSYPGVRLLQSGDYSTYSSPDFWITIVAQPYPTADAANAWCDAQGLGSDDCFAKQLSHTAPPAGSTKHRPS